MSLAHKEDYKAYYVFLASVPDGITVIDPNLFRIQNCS